MEKKESNHKGKNSRLRNWISINEKKIKIVAYSILGVLVAIYLIKGRIEYVRFDREYFTDGYQCNAVVTRVSGVMGTKMCHRDVNYKYEYQGVVYDGECEIHDDHQMKVGDSIAIIVSRVNPEYSKEVDPDHIRII